MMQNWCTIFLTNQLIAIKFPFQFLHFSSFQSASAKIRCGERQSSRERTVLLQREKNFWGSSFKKILQIEVNRLSSREDAARFEALFESQKGASNVGNRNWKYWYTQSNCEGTKLNEKLPLNSGLVRRSRSKSPFSRSADKLKTFTRKKKESSASSSFAKSIRALNYQFVG